MVPLIIKKHLLSSEVVKNLKSLTKNLHLAYDVTEILPLAISLKKDYPHFKKGSTYYVWHIIGTILKGKEAGYEKHLIYKMYEGDNIEFDTIKLEDVEKCEVLKENFQYKTITYQRKISPKWHYPYFVPLEAY